MSATSLQKSHRGVIVPMVTPLTARGKLDKRAVGRLVEHLQKGGVHGVFVLGTTGEGPSVPNPMREALVRLVVECARQRLLVYANVSDDSASRSIRAGNLYLRLGVDAVVAHAPARYERQPAAAREYFAELIGRLDGDLILYNMPLTTHVSLPVDICDDFARRARVIGMKDSENNQARHDSLLERIGRLDSFSFFVGTGPLMANGLMRGARGIVPSVGNIAPALCRELYDSATRGDSKRTATLNRRFLELAQVYQKGRTLMESLGALKGAMSCLGLCGPHVFPPLSPIAPGERVMLAAELARLGIPSYDSPADEDATSRRPDHGRPRRSGARTVPSSPQQS